MHAWNGVPAAQLERPKGIGWWLLFIKVNLIVFMSQYYLWFISCFLFLA
jgi:hypothetical protein